MRAAFYDRQGPADAVLQVGDLAIPEPGQGEVRVRVSFSGINPGDVKKRQGAEGALMPFPRVVPHSDGSGVIDAVGPGGDTQDIGARVWVYGAQSYRAFGTAAESTVVPAALAVKLPAGVSDEVGACLGIPGITAHRAVFGDGPVSGETLLVHGVLGGVGSMAAQLARWRGAVVIGTVRRSSDLQQVPDTVADDVVALDQANAAQAIRAAAPHGVDRIIEVAFSDNVGLDADVAHNGTVIAAYGTRAEFPTFPFWPMLFDNITMRLLGSDDFPAEAKQVAAQDLTAGAAGGHLAIAMNDPYELESIAEAHGQVMRANTRGRTLLRLH